jgi:hypothetical protein
MRKSGQTGRILTLCSRFRKRLCPCSTAKIFTTGGRVAPLFPIVVLVSHGETWYVFAEDRDRNGGATIYQATIKRSTALAGATRLYIGSIRVP